MVQKAHETRRREFGEGPFIVIKVEGDAPVGKPRAERESEDFIVWLDGGSKKAIQAEHRHRVTAALNSVILYDERVEGIRIVADSVTYFRDDGKPIYARTSTVRGTLSVSRPIRDDAAAIIQGPIGSHAEERFLLRIKGVMKTKKRVMKAKYGIAGKFAAIAAQLDPNNADDDLQVVEQVKKQRDGISHGESFVEAQLPLERIRSLARKYLLLHIASRAPGLASAP